MNDLKQQDERPAKARSVHSYDHFQDTISNDAYNDDRDRDNNSVNSVEAGDGEISKDANVAIDGVSSNDGNSSKFFANAAETLSEKAKELKAYASEVGGKISEQYSEISNRIKAYVGNREDAESFTVDNEYIVHGYRINHNTCRSLCKSLFTCHNEAVNVWSHIGGVIVFLALLTFVWADVLPNQFWYAYEINREFK